MARPWWALVLPWGLAGCLALSASRLEDRTTAPLLPGTALELVADLDYPPGNIAVSRTGRVFFTYHPTGSPPVKVVELVGGRPVPYPDAAHQASFKSVLALRIDRQERLWLLDYGAYGWAQPRLVAFDLASGSLVHDYDFPSDVAGFLSMVNDFQVDPAGETIYITETSPIRQRPALLVYDVASRRTRRLLDGHPSVRAMRYVTHTPAGDLKVLGFFPVRIGVDSIALDARGEWLYYGPFTGDRLYRIPTRDLRDQTLAPDVLAARVEDFGPKTVSDGLSRDLRDTIYITDPEHSAILTLGPDRALRTLVKDPRLRWPDGLSFGPEGWLYVTCSALHQVMFRTTAAMRAHAPFQIFRLKPGAEGIPGH